MLQLWKNEVAHVGGAFESFFRFFRFIFFIEKAKKNEY